MTSDEAIDRSAQPGRLRRRRVFFASATLGTALLALLAMARVLGADGLSPSDWILLGCFAAMLPWNVIGFWNALVGFALLYGSRDPVGRVLPAARSPAHSLRDAARPRPASGQPPPAGGGRRRHARQ